MSTERYTHIKNRMIKKAASIWGVAPTEIESSFDPVVSLLIAACASEIVNLENDLDESYNRITEKIIQLMTPETVIGAEPAHAILHIDSIDDSVVVKPEFQFYFNKKVIENKTTLKKKSIFFSPVEDFKLINAKINTLIAGNTVFALKDGVKNELGNLSAPFVENNVLYVGVESPLSELDFNDVSFYFNLEDIEQNELFHYYLKNTKWSVNGMPITSVSGFASSSLAEEKDFLKTIFKQESEKIQKVDNKTLTYYKKHYITLKTGAKKIPVEPHQEIHDALTNKGIDVSANTLWVKVEFSTAINRTIEKINCSINSFPVLNRCFNTLTYQIKEFVNIIPIETEDYFFDIKSITNTSGKTYLPKIKTEDDTKKGTFTLRDASAGKLDHRTAREYLFHMMELLKNESAAFSLMNKDFLSDNLKDLNQLMSLLSKKVKDSVVSLSETNFVVLEPFHERESVFVEYWSTNGKDANGIKSGNKVLVYKAVGVDTNGGYLVTNTQGGRNDLDMNERLNSYRSALLSKGKIVTKEDIKALCYDLYGDRINNVVINRTFINSYQSKQGIVKCIEIVLQKNEGIDLPEFEWHELKTNLLSLLENKSLNIYPYKITLLN